MKTIKIIILIEKISREEEVPYSIKYNGRIYEYADEIKWYLRDDMKCELTNSKLCLNDEVAVIEEEKKIPEKICTNRIINTKDILEFEMIQNKINAEYTYAINEIIDYLKSKGE